MNKLYGFGTHRLKGDACIEAVKYALLAGYNFIDTAEKYDNSREIGQAIRESGISRENIMIVHKLTDVDDFSRTQGETISKVGQYLQQLKTSYIDVLLMHGPSPRYHPNPEIYKEGNIEVWKAMIALKEAKIVRAIGVSNFNEEQIAYLIRATRIIPDYLEIEYNAVNYREMETVKSFADSLGIQVIAYSPLKAGDIVSIIMSEEYLKYLSNNENICISATEYALRFCLTAGTIPIPRSTNVDRILDNLNSLKKGPL